VLHLKTEELIKSTDAWEVSIERCTVCLVAVRLGLISDEIACKGLASPAVLMLAYQVLKELLVVMLFSKKFKPLYH
jgi:hypothetical protein